MKFSRLDDESHLQAYRWLTRTGAGVSFGGRPIGWYQMHQEAAIDVLTELGKTVAYDPEFRMKDGSYEAQSVKGRPWFVLASVGDVFREADRRARR